MKHFYSSFLTTHTRYLFQAQEMDNEIKGDGNSVNYKYRMHDPRLGRFFAVDPLAFKYPHNGTYNFSENRVIDGLELEGLEVILLNGTDMPAGTKWMLNPDAIKEIKRIGGHSETSKVEHFKWGTNNNYLNTRNGDRKIAAEDLVDFVVNQRSEQLKAKQITKDEPITLFGYSNGGNVGTQGIDDIARRTGVKVNLITYGTPAFNDGSSEDPATKEKLSKHVHLWSPHDGVCGEIVGNNTYNNGFTINYKLPNSVIKYQGGTGIQAHIDMGNMSKNKGLGEFLKNNVASMKNLPDFKKTKQETTPSYNNYSNDESGAPVPTN